MKIWDTRLLHGSLKQHSNCYLQIKTELTRESKIQICLQYYLVYFTIEGRRTKISKKILINFEKSKNIANSSDFLYEICYSFTKYFNLHTLVSIICLQFCYYFISIIQNFNLKALHETYAFSIISIVRTYFIFTQ